MPQSIANFHLELLESIQAESILMARGIDMLYEGISGFSAQVFLGGQGWSWCDGRCSG